MRKEIFLTVFLLMVAFSIPVTGSDDESKASAKDGPLKPIQDEHIHNLFQYNEVMYSGSEPASPEAFDTLKKLGIKTVISVDGAKPRIELAKARGMRYVHLPMQYHSVSEEQKQAFAKALMELEGPIYVHCHHGKHRGPTASTLAMVGLGLWDAETGLEALKQSGTGDYYTDLYACVREGETFQKKQLKEAQIEFPETAKLPAFIDAMVVAQSHLDRLALSQKENFRVPEKHGDINPPHEALQLREVLHEMGRMKEVQQQPEPFRAMMQGSEKAVQKLEDQLREWSNQPEKTHPPESLEKAWNTVVQSCKGCHQVYRVKEVEGLSDS